MILKYVDKNTTYVKERIYGLCEEVCTTSKCSEKCERYKHHKGNHYHFIFAHGGDYVSTFSWKNEANHELRELIKELEKPE